MKSVVAIPQKQITECGTVQNPRHLAPGFEVRFFLSFWYAKDSKKWLKVGSAKREGIGKSLAFSAESRQCLYPGGVAIVKKVTFQGSGEHHIRLPVP